VSYGAGIAIVTELNLLLRFLEQVKSGFLSDRSYLSLANPISLCETGESPSPLALLSSLPIEARTLFILFRNTLLGQRLKTLELPSAMLRYLVKREFFIPPPLLII
jgi:hypothetical protein